MSMLNFEINRAGKNLPAERKRVNPSESRAEEALPLGAGAVVSG
jgi:hypothetical protein